VAATKQSPADGEETSGKEHNDDADAGDENDAEMSRQLQRLDAMQVNTLAGHLFFNVSSENSGFKFTGVCRTMLLST